MYTRLLIIIFVFIVILVFIGYSVFSAKTILKIEKYPKIKGTDINNFSSVIKKGVVIVNFYATWHDPSIKMRSTLNEIAEKADNLCTIAEVNIENQKKLAAKYKIKGIPTLIIFKDGIELNRIVGIESKNSIIEAAKRYC